MPTRFPLSISPAAPSLVTAAELGSRPDISARSVLVTIFGDSVVPAGGEIWLGDLIELCRQFGFNDRLVRTSMFRLSADGWFETERVGRRSRYRLTPWARAEFAEAEARIYGGPPPHWDGQWTLVFLDNDVVDRSAAESLRSTLGWHGFAAVSGGVMAIPGFEPLRVSQLAERAGISVAVPVASARFDHLASLVEVGWLSDAFGLDPVADRYDELIRRYQGLADVDAQQLSDEEAFGWRTMLVHDLRRTRLADPDLPAEVLPPTWPAPSARALAATVYRGLSAGAERWIAATTGLPLDPAVARTRFAALA